MTDWRAANRANWDERVGVHLRSADYDLAPLRTGAGRLNAIEEAELGPVAGLRVLHLQCHFGRDSLILAQRGAAVTGLDFSAPAIAQARALAAELGLAGRVRFVQADLYDAPTAIMEPAAFDLVYVTWGALCWLPDVTGWARIVAHFLKPGGTLYLAEDHPVPLVFDDVEPGASGRARWFAPYFQSGPIRVEDGSDYADAEARLANRVTFQWPHPLGEVVTALIAAKLRLLWLHEHPRATWRMFPGMGRDADGCWVFRDRPWLPLSYSLKARQEETLNSAASSISR